MGYDIKKEPMAVKSIIGISAQETAISRHLNSLENLALICGVCGVSKEEIKKRSE
jgi:ABC-2 type transport system ATP-binding protein